MDAEDSGPETISVLIKTPNQVREDHILEDVHLDWTVRELKTRLSAVYATRPAVTDQRLIYSGKLLPDHLHIRDIFRQTDSTPALHLVCAFRNPPQEPLGPKSTETEQAPLQPRTCSSFIEPQQLLHRPDSELSRAEAEETDYSCCRSGVSTGESSMAACCNAGSATNDPADVPHLLPVQPPAAAVAPARLRSAVLHAVPRSVGGGGLRPLSPASVTGQFPPVPAHQVPVPAPLANQNPIDNLPANQNAAQDGRFHQPGEANQNMRMNAQGGAVMEDEDAIERDWLDWLYSAARFCVLLMIVYFNSNLSRFLMVASTLLLMYLHTAGLFPFRRPQVQEPNPLQPPEVQHNQQNEDRIPNPNPAVEPADEQREEPAAAAEGPDGPGPMAAVLVPPHRVSVIWTAWVFFKTFFSSLVPEAPQGAAN